jgi:peptidoglycan biosynthesis protein MviN/MurJ (putative lipid II flippase)
MKQEQVMSLLILCGFYLIVGMLWWMTRRIRAQYWDWLMMRYGHFTVWVSLIVFAISPLLALFGLAKSHSGWVFVVGSGAFVFFGVGYLYEMVIFARSEYRRKRNAEFRQSLKMRK